jgi:hypothetical protein
VAGLATLASLLAGCGGGKPAASVASLGPSTTTTTKASSGAGATNGNPGNASFVAFVDCMQKHGIQAQLGQGGKGVQISGGDPNSPQFAAAQKTCQKLLPGGGPKPLTPAEQAQNVQELVKLAACMRTHGYPKFPDPSSQGVFTLTASNGFNPNSSQFQSAMNTCTPSGAKLRIGIRVQGPGPGP